MYLFSITSYRKRGLVLTPDAYLRGNPSIWTQLLADQLTGKLCSEKRDTEDGVAEVEVIGSEP